MTTPPQPQRDSPPPRGRSSADSGEPGQPGGPAGPASYPHIPSDDGGDRPRESSERPKGRDRFAQGERLELKDWRSGSGRVFGVDIPEPRGGHLSVAVPPGVPGAAPEPAVTGPHISDRIWTPPNVLSMGRIALIPVFAASVALWDRPGLALILLAVLGVSDWLDGKIARLFDMRSKLGAKLDPIADRILITVVPLVFAFAGHVPWWVVFVLLARDATLVVSLLVYRRRDTVPEVIYLGKAASFALMWSFPMLLAAAANVWFDDVLRLLGEAALYWGVGLYLWSGLVYLGRAIHIARLTPAVPLKIHGDQPKQ